MIKGMIWGGVSAYDGVEIIFDVRGLEAFLLAGESDGAIGVADISIF